MKTFKNTLARIGVALVIVAAAALMLIDTKSNAQSTQSTQVTLKVKTGSVTHGSYTGFDLGEIAVSFDTGYLSGQFQDPNYFRVQDLLGANSGYYTTIESSDLTSSAPGTIAKTFVSLKSVDNVVDKLAGAVNTNVTIWSSFSGTYATLDTPKTYIQRTAGANGGKVGKYGDLPWLQVEVPPYQTVGSYTGTLTYTLYVN